MIGTIIVFAFIAFIVLALIGAFIGGGKRAEATMYLADRYKQDRRKRKR